jgi:hypothetical protein
LETAKTISAEGPSGGDQEVALARRASRARGTRESAGQDAGNGQKYNNLCGTAQSDAGAIGHYCRIVRAAVNLSNLLLPPPRAALQLR